MCLIGSTWLITLPLFVLTPTAFLVVLRLGFQVRVHEGKLVFLLREIHEGLKPVLLLLRSSPKGSWKIQSLERRPGQSYSNGSPIQPFKAKARRQDTPGLLSNLTASYRLSPASSKRGHKRLCQRPYHDSIGIPYLYACQN